MLSDPRTDKRSDIRVPDARDGPPIEPRQVSAMRHGAAARRHTLCNCPAHAIKPQAHRGHGGGDGRAHGRRHDDHAVRFRNGSSGRAGRHACFIAARRRRDGASLAVAADARRLLPVISDHADWCKLCDTIREVSPQEVRVTHGREEALVRWCELQGDTGEAAASDGGMRMRARDSSVVRTSMLPMQSSPPHVPDSLIRRLLRGQLRLQ